jgi:hypothetical protein
MNQRNRSVWRFVVPVVATAAILFGSPGAASAAPEPVAELLAPRVVSIIQSSSNRFMDAHEIESLDFNVVTRPFQNNTTQQWRLTDIGNGIFTIQQVSNNRYLDAHEISSNDFRVVTRPAQNNPTQAWLIIDAGSGLFTIQQVSSSRYLDAHETSAEDFQVVTRPSQNNNTQLWRIVDV